MAGSAIGGSFVVCLNALSDKGMPNALYLKISLYLWHVSLFVSLVFLSILKAGSAIGGGFVVCINALSDKECQMLCITKYLSISGMCFFLFYLFFSLFKRRVLLLGLAL